MSTEQIVQLLIQERDRLNRAIEALSGSTGKRRGRPPKNPLIGMPVVAAAIPETKTRQKRVWSAAQKKAAAARMKARWAAKKKAAKKA
jgi:hypothetical protein